MLGRLEKQKRLEDAVVAFAKVVTQQPQATLTIYGEGSQRAELEKLVGKLGLRASVRLPGHDPAAKDYLRSATALLLTSRFEGYPLVVLEALDRGCPVIAYDIAYGPREQIADGESGYLVPAGDTGALAERMLRLIADPDLTARMSTAARLSSASHSIDAYLTSWQGVLRAVTAKA
nr:glycosyltransferase [Kineosporia mesophila]